MSKLLVAQDRISFVNSLVVTRVQMWLLGWRTLVVSMSTRRASAKARKVQRPSKLTVVIRANTVAHEPVVSMRYPEKYTIRTPAQEDKVTINGVL